MWHNTIYIYFLYLYFRTFFKFKIRILLITTHTFHIIYLFVYLYMYRRKCTNKNVNLHVKFLKDKTRSSWRIIIIVCCCLTRSVSETQRSAKVFIVQQRRSQHVRTASRSEQVWFWYIYFVFKPKTDCGKYIWEARSSDARSPSGTWSVEWKYL